MNPTGPDHLQAILEEAANAAGRWAETDRHDRADVLDAIARDLDSAGEELIAIAQEETHLLEGRLRGELQRTTFQLRLFAEVLRDGGYLEARIDHADAEWPMGAPRPDLRRILLPLGPVVVFAGSNFPFAFSVAGGDTASALAAGCPVVLKAHSGHPRLSQRTGELVRDAAVRAGAPDGVFAVIFGTEAGRVAVQDPRIKAGSFTGSIAGGRALFDLAAARPEPIPFYGELGSVNPVFVTREADARRGAEIATQFVASVTLGAGQFCTKPGVLVAPAGSAAVDALRSIGLPDAAPLLNDRIQSGYVHTLEEFLVHPEVTVLSRGEDALADPPSPTIMSTPVTAVLTHQEELFRECFGPTALVVTYDDEAQLLELAQAMDGQLTATVAGEGSERILPELITLLSRRAGRLLWNQWPTGVSVTYAQQHGGPYPATTAPGTTSVGTAAIARFLRPVAYQGFPQNLLPDDLRDTPEHAFSRMIDGRAAAPERNAIRS